MISRIECSECVAVQIQVTQWLSMPLTMINAQQFKFNGYVDSLQNECLLHQQRYITENTFRTLFRVWRDSVPQVWMFKGNENPQMFFVNFNQLIVSIRNFGHVMEIQRKQFWFFFLFDLVNRANFYQLRQFPGLVHLCGSQLNSKAHSLYIDANGKQTQIEKQLGMRRNKKNSHSHKYQARRLRSVGGCSWREGKRETEKVSRSATEFGVAYTPQSTESTCVCVCFGCFFFKYRLKLNVCCVFVCLLACYCHITEAMGDSVALHACVRVFRSFV